MVHAPSQAVVLVTSDWAGPARPAPTVLRELSRRWGSTVATLIIDDPHEDVLDRLEVDVLPTWLGFERGEVPDDGVAGTDVHATGSALLVVEELRGLGMTGEDLVLAGPWRLVHRRRGALPKHVVASEFGPRSGRADA
ncbi:hypothetical protein ACFQS2_00850 [Brachybacterium sp. GCM10030267]|uniref:hypothetical protein n=1 Tax=Brachybacterium sp. GCM10030267 TaxID=3273381 RepID=UPI0036189604